MKLSLLTTLLFSAVAISACNMTQAPAQVVMKGSNFYGTPNTEPVKVAQYAPRNVTRAPVSQSADPSSIPVVHMASSAEPRSSQGFQSTPVTNTVHTSAELSQVTVSDLPPLTAAKAPEPVSVAEITPATETIASSEVPDLAAETAEHPLSAPEVLPESQARVVADSNTIPEAPAPASVSGKGFIWPVKGKIISAFGASADGEYNDGINIAAQEGEPIVAAADGEVVYSGNELRGYGNMVIVRHNNGLMTAYAHADRILVSKGEHVRQGVTIATVGKSGGVDKAQVHFGVRKNKEPIDPMTVLNQNNFASR